MPLPPVPPENTQRLYVQQKGAHGEHILQMRFGLGVGVDAMVARARAICQAMAPLVVPATSFYGALHSASGTNLRFPVAWGAAIAGTSGETFSQFEWPQFVSFTGRSLQGYRCRITCPGYAGVMPETYRLQSTNTIVAAVLAQLRATAPELVAVNGGPVLWNNYANLGVNAHFQREARRS